MSAMRVRAADDLRVSLWVSESANRPRLTGPAPDGWTPDHWHRELIRMATVCQDTNPLAAREYREQAGCMEAAS